MLATVQEPAAREDVSLAAAVSTEGLDRFARYQRGHERRGPLRGNHNTSRVEGYQEKRCCRGTSETPVLERTIVARTVHTACRQLVLDCLRATVAEML